MHLRSMKKFAGAAVVSAALILAQSLAMAAEGTVTIAMASDVPSLDPTLDTSPIGQNVRLNVFDQLTQIGRDGSVEPRLAESWEVSDDAKTWTFTLRTDALFHDGSPVRVEDVMWTYETILGNEKSSVRPYLSKIESMEKVSDNQLSITLV